MFLACDNFTTAPASEPGKAGMLFWQGGGGGTAVVHGGAVKSTADRRLTWRRGGEPKTFAQAVMGDVGPTTSAAS